MSAKLESSGSLRNRLVLSLTGGASILALLLFFAVRNYATQIAQQGRPFLMSELPKRDRHGRDRKTDPSDRTRRSQFAVDR